MNPLNGPNGSNSGGPKHGPKRVTKRGQKRAQKKGQKRGPKTGSNKAGQNSGSKAGSNNDPNVGPKSGPNAVPNPGSKNVCLKDGQNYGLKDSHKDNTNEGPQEGPKLAKLDPKGTFTANLGKLAMYMICQTLRYHLKVAFLCVKSFLPFRLGAHNNGFIKELVLQKHKIQDPCLIETRPKTSFGPLINTA